MKKTKFKDCTDNELVAFIVENENDAFVELMKRYKDKCVNYIFRFVGDYDEAFDLSQEVFVKVFLHSKSFKQQQRFSTWFFTIAANISRDSIKKSIKRNIVSFEDLEVSGEVNIAEFAVSENSPEKEYDKNYISERVQIALQSLKPHYREALILKEIQQFTFEEVAEILQIEIGTVKSRVFRGKTLIKDLLKDLFTDFIKE